MVFVYYWVLHICALVMVWFNIVAAMQNSLATECWDV